MRIVKLTPELVVQDVIRSIEFYTKVVGLKLIEGNNNWARLCADENGMEIILMSKNGLDKEIPNLKRIKNEGWSLLAIEVDEIEDFYKKIKNGIKLHREMQSTDYGTREFTIEDADGYLIQFTQRT